MQTFAVLKFPPTEGAIPQSLCGTGYPRSRDAAIYRREKIGSFIHNTFSGKARLPPAMDLTASRTKDRRREKSAAVLKEILLGGGGSIMQQRPETVKLRPKNR